MGRPEFGLPEHFSQPQLNLVQDSYTRYVACVWSWYSNWLNRSLRTAFKLWKTIEGVKVFVPTSSGARRAHFEPDVLAFAYGECVYVRAKRVWTRALWLHEREHVRQFQRLGPLFQPLYLLELLIRGYAKNRFEVAANRAERLGASPKRRAKP